jgi:2-iminobutanoate/2-iminopropanoate deaminase
MSQKEIIEIDMEKSNPNLSAATKFGDLVFVSGQTGTHPVTGVLGEGIREQTSFTLERIKVILEKAGTSLNNVLSATTYLTKREDLQEYNKVYGEYFTGEKPARATVEVMLNREELLVEIVVIACIPS